MLKAKKSIYSKKVLILYLAAAGLLVFLLFSNQNRLHKEEREIPDSLRPLLFSPANPLPQLVLYDKNQRVFTENNLKQHWRFIYFIHANCEPECLAIVEIMQNLKKHFAGNTVQFVMVNFMPELAMDINFPSSIPVYSTQDNALLEKLMKPFHFLYLASDKDTVTESEYSQSSSVFIEQQHFIYLIDPQNRAYATFEPPFNSLLIQKQFISLRQFYAISEN